MLFVSANYRDSVVTISIAHNDQQEAMANRRLERFIIQGLTHELSNDMLPPFGLEWP